MGKNNKRPPYKKNPRAQFDKRGSFKRSKRQDFDFEKNDGDYNADETVYRILCPIKKIGSVIGKGGDIIEGLREETHAKIKVGESVPGTDERVVIIFSSSTKKPRVDDSDGNQEAPETNDAPEEPHPGSTEEQEPDPSEGGTGGGQGPDTSEAGRDPDTAEGLNPMEPLCPAQHALLKVHERIAEDDGHFGGPILEEKEEEDTVIARLLVPSNQVGCLLGKGGHVIQKLRTETGANIRILPEDHLPACALSTDELVQISGISAIVKKALYEVSTLLHQNPRPPMQIPISDGARGFYPPAGPVGSMPPQGNPMFQRNRGPPRIPRESEFPRYPPGNASAEFTMKILCPADRIGFVIGKGGNNVRQIQHETGTDIHVEHTNPEAEERAFLVSALDAPWNPISPTIEAILMLQSKISTISEEGTITTRLLVPSSKVGCLLGQGGHIINEMRRRSHADIRVFSKEGKPDYAPADEELVQVSGNTNVARDALTEVASRLRMRSLEGTNGAVEPGPPGPFRGFGRAESFPERRLPPPGMTGARSSGRQMKGGGHDFEAQRYPNQQTTAFPNINSSMQVKIPNSAISSVLGVGGSNISSIGQMSGATVKLNDPQAAGGSECIVEIHGSFEQMSAAQNLLQNYISPSVQKYNARQHAPHSSAAQSFNQPHPHSQPHPQAHPHPQPQPQPQPSPYASAMPNANVQHQQNPYATLMQSSSVQQNQNPYPSVAAAPSLNSQQHQSPYASAVPNYNAQQQQSPYASTVPGYNAYQHQQQQQQQSTYSSAVHNYSTQQQERSTYPPVLHNYDGQQQQAPYQY